MEHQNGISHADRQRTTRTAFANHSCNNRGFEFCAGSAKVEALGITILEKVESDDPTALIGLPLIALTDMLRTAGVDLYGGVK